MGNDDVEQCPVCDGIGDYYEDGYQFNCTECDGTGQIDWGEIDG